MTKNLLILLLLISTTAFAQTKKHGKIKAFKTAYITEKLELTSKEAEVFWPIYNHYDQQLHNIRRKERHDIYLKINDDVSKITDSEAEELLKKTLLFEEESLVLRKEMTVALGEVLPPRKIILLRKVEHDFKRELLNRYRNGHRGKKTDEKEE